MLLPIFYHPSVSKKYRYGFVPNEATNEDAENLEIAMGKPIQSFTTTGFNVFGEVIEFSLARYRGDRSRFEVSANI